MFFTFFAWFSFFLAAGFSYGSQTQSPYELHMPDNAHLKDIGKLSTDCGLNSILCIGFPYSRSSTSRACYHAYGYFVKNVRISREGTDIFQKVRIFSKAGKDEISTSIFNHPFLPPALTLSFIHARLMCNVKNHKVFYENNGSCING